MTPAAAAASVAATFQAPARVKDVAAVPLASF